MAAEGEEEFKGQNRLLYCRHCPQNDPYSTSVTTNFRKHLDGKHGIRVVEDLTPLQSSIFEGFEQLYQQARDLGRTTEIESEVFKRYLDQDKISKALAWMIVARNLPYRIVECPEFHHFVSTLNPVAKDQLPSAHSTVPRIIDNHFQWAKDIVSYKSDSELSSRIQRGWEVFDKYYSKTETSPYYAAALILYPSYRTTYIQANWKKKWQRPAFKQVKDLWLAHRDAMDDSLSAHVLDDEEDEDLDAFDRISRNLQNCTRPSSQDEYEDYISCDPYDITPATALS
ncbi:BED zinc finger domain-containing protein [Purpureocillium lilacinum]|uniref:BED zinc finger domain-containing protein n=1 Tax=Purpureocillium lilacinum TaxID=33203 RepID=A0A179F4S2_PURLI|nr:BED zinc finger domain-containing protein [Purpureocillium lilacinum]OAQ60402.1 BED zinc finger domain-containing protein [Purpureocillium lilacinum]